MGIEMQLFVMLVLGFLLGRYLRYSIIDFVLRLFGKKMKDDIFVQEKFFEMMDELKDRLHKRSSYGPHKD